MKPEIGWHDALAVYAAAFALSAAMSFVMTATLALALVVKLLYYGILVCLFMVLALRQTFPMPVAAGLAASAAFASWVINVLSRWMPRSSSGWLPLFLGLAVMVIAFAGWNRTGRRWWAIALVAGVEAAASLAALVAFEAGVFDAASAPLVAVAVLPFDWGPAMRVLGAWALISFVFLEFSSTQPRTSISD